MQHACCPTCGNLLTDDLSKYKFTNQQKIIFNIIFDAGKHGITIPRMIDLLYSNAKDGGALAADTSIRVQVSHIRTKIKKFGLVIPHYPLNGLYKVEQQVMG